MTRTTSWPAPFCLTAAIGTVSAPSCSWVDHLDRDRRAVGRAEVALDLHLALVDCVFAVSSVVDVVVELGDDTRRRPGAALQLHGGGLADLQLGAVGGGRLAASP